MNDLVTGMLRGLQDHLNNHGIVSHVELETELPTILGHKGQLQEVLFNLFHNALDAMKSSSIAKRILRVRTEKRGRKAIGVFVQDSGPGIVPEYLGQIFDAFVTTKKDGMGMGLAICRMIIERHGGQLSASSGIDTGRNSKLRCRLNRLPIRTLSQLGKLSPLPSHGCTCVAYYERHVHPAAAPRAAVRSR